jgi:16S rRNA (guanine1207-N2)-methyltransferase
MPSDDDLPIGGEPYFAAEPRSRPSPRELRFLYRGELLTFGVDRGIFASHGLDPGTALLIENLGVGRTERVLDLGCGWGAVGVAAAKSARDGAVVLTEVNRRAARLAEKNLARNRIRNAEVRVGAFFEPVANETFDTIATNPPYRTGRADVLRLLGEAPAHLRDDGRLLLVGKSSQGIRFYQEWLGGHFPGSVEVVGRGSGYRVLEARRRGSRRPA